MGFSRFHFFFKPRNPINKLIQTPLRIPANIRKRRRTAPRNPQNANPLRHYQSFFWSGFGRNIEISSDIHKVGPFYIIIIRHQRHSTTYLFPYFISSVESLLATKQDFFLFFKKKPVTRMPGLTAPSDYALEPPRHPALQINAKQPFNAEPPRSALISSYVTPVDFFYKRNHGPIPIVEDVEKYYFSITGLIENPKDLFMKDIMMLPKYNVTATLQCAGNRRTAMSKSKTVKGVGWDVSAVGNAVWGGAKLADVLELVGIPKQTSVTKSGGKHVEFVSIDKCKEENGGPYKASIPLSQATDPEADVLLAYEMNGELLNRDHGYPLRGIVPGVIGARSVKWLEAINIIAEECQGFFMQKDYKMFPPSVNWDNINWTTRRPLMDFPVQCVICSLEDMNVIKPGKVKISGYAVSGGGRGIERVDVSIDGGKNWVEASRYQKMGVPYVADDISSDKWAWVLFEVMVDIPQSTQIVAKAVDTAANVQPENVETIWNLRGVLNTSWHRVSVRVGHSNI